jgi:RNA polymerase sigma-70 factor (ECF subfamily)
MVEDTLADLLAQFEDAVEHPPPDGGARVTREHRLRQALADNGIAPTELLTTQTDEVLALALQQDFFFPEAYNEFYRRYEPQVRSWLMRRNVEYHQAFDLSQTLLLRCLVKRLHCYDVKKGPLRGYLHQAAHRLWIEKVVRPPNPGWAPFPEQFPQPGPGPAEEYDRKETAQRLTEAIAALPGRWRDALNLLYLDGLTYPEIAARLGMTVTALYGVLFKARRALEERLGLALPPTNRGRPRKQPPPGSN